jgi:hypothetical protein
VKLVCRKRITSAEVSKGGLLTASTPSMEGCELRRSAILSVLKMGVVREEFRRCGVMRVRRDMGCGIRRVMTWVCELEGEEIGLTFG